MKTYKVIYESIDGKTSIKKVPANTNEDAERWVMDHCADYFQTVAIQEVK